MFIDKQIRAFLEAVMYDAKHHEADIYAEENSTTNSTHIEYLPDSDTIIIDDCHKYPAAVTNIPAVRYAVHRALMY